MSYLYTRVYFVFYLHTNIDLINIIQFLPFLRLKVVIILSTYVKPYKCFNLTCHCLTSVLSISLLYLFESFLVPYTSIYFFYV